MRRLALLALAGLSFACGGGGGPVTPFDPDLDGDGLPDALEATLIAQYRPYWFFDDTETIRPISVGDWAALGGTNVFADFELPYTDLPTLLGSVLALPLGTLHLPPGLVAGRAGAPVYADAVPMPPDFEIAGRRNLVWLHYWLLFGDDVKIYLPVRSHRGDWEHVCVMVERDAAGVRDRPPVMIHWHHHGSADIAAEADAWHADARGAFHPRAYVEAGGHGIYRLPGRFPGQHDDGGGTLGDPLTDPLVFMQEHAGQTGVAAVESTIVRGFQGRWGQTLTAETASPFGPLVFNGPCDHDYVARPAAGSFALGGCEGL